MLDVKEKLLEDLIEKLSTMDDPLMESLGLGAEKPKAKIDIVKMVAKPEDGEHGEDESDAEEAGESAGDEKEELLKKKLKLMGA